MAGSEWNLEPDQIGDLALVLPAARMASSSLGSRLLFPTTGSSPRLRRCSR